ncbi:MAG: hypothetical protein MI784_11645 [Cytophagales bacterium]|nr:hypothetical protein [Cytophagales bacterium]
MKHIFYLSFFILFLSGACGSKNSKNKPTSVSQNNPVIPLSDTRIDIVSEKSNDPYTGGVLMAYHINRGKGWEKQYLFVFRQVDRKVALVPVARWESTTLRHDFQPAIIYLLNTGGSIKQALQMYEYNAYQPFMTYKADISADVEVSGAYCSGKLRIHSILTPKDTSLFVFSKMAVIDVGNLNSIK